MAAAELPCYAFSFDGALRKYVIQTVYKRGTELRTIEGISASNFDELFEKFREYRDPRKSAAMSDVLDSFFSEHA